MVETGSVAMEYDAWTGYTGNYYWICELKSPLFILQKVAKLWVNIWPFWKFKVLINLFLRGAGIRQSMLIMAAVVSVLILDLEY